MTRDSKKKYSIPIDYLIKSPVTKAILVKEIDCLK